MKQTTLFDFITKPVERALSPPRSPQECRLGILGNRRDIKNDEITEIFTLMLEDIPPIQSILVSADGDLSIYVEQYAEKAKIPIQIYEADWRRDGRRAQIFRDARIVREATHYLIFGGPRSQKPLQTAEQLCKKGKTVYYIPHGALELQAFESQSTTTH